MDNLKLTRVIRELMAMEQEQKDKANIILETQGKTEVYHMFIENSRQYNKILGDLIEAIDR